MKNIAASLLLGFYMIGFSQTYEPIIDQTKRWDVLNTFYDDSAMPGEPFVYYTTSALTFGEIALVNGVSYNEIIGMRSIVANYMRENTMGQVFISPGVNGDNESLIYDFNLQVGDVISLPEYFHNEYLSWTVTHVEMVAFAGQNRKKITLDYNGNIEIWYEGIGSDKGVIYAGHMSIDFDETLACYFLNDNLLHSFSACSTASVPIFNDLSFAEEFKLYPNPATNQLIISSKLTDYDIEIYSILGKKVLNTKSESAISQIDISKLNAGIYLVKIKNQTNIATFKFIKK